ncbi:S9 family peptidase [Sphingomonas sp. MMS24-J13]|uniref:S9 family peptidase n=1 Tax=Sphingomonas sp. MMS24-J13 TaxID=3238686 RepID=UPI00384A65C6
MLKRLWLACSTGIALAAATQAAPPPPKLEAFLSYPFESELTAPKAGGRLAWIEMRKGIRNIWIADGPDYKPRQLTDGTRDDGQEFSSLAFSPDGKMLAWVHGGGEHNSWANNLPPPNPDSSVIQPQMEIWVSIGGGAPVKVAEGEAPVFAPGGKLTFLKDGQVFTVDPSGQGKPVKLFYDHGKIGGLAWSPDGSKLAFVSHRGDHSFIGVYSSPDRPLAWIAPTTSFDDNPAWSPDGTRIAFSRQAGIADILSSPLEEKPNPFSIWVGSIADGTAKLAWRSPKVINGSFPQVPDGLFLMWGAGDRLTFRAEMDGWPHLYSLPASGGEPTLLTPGNFMVEHVSMTPDHRSLLYSANSGTAEGDIDRRHIFRVAVDKPGPVGLTPGSGLEWTPVGLGDKIAFVGSTATTPMRVTLADAGGKNARPLETTTIDYTAKLIVPRPVTFTASDGMLIHGQLFLPKGRGKHPGLIFVHGGPPRQMLLGWSYMDYYTHAYAMNQYYASRGFAVLSVNYRLGIGYGRAFQHPAKAGVAGNSEYLDVLAGAAFLKAQPEVDPARLGIWGGSYGGLLTAHALAHNSDMFKVGVDFHGVHDWTLYPGKVGRPQRYEQGDYDIVLKTAFESSPEAAIAGWKSPVLLIHGDDDRNVRFDQTVDLARRLAAQDTPFEELILPNEIHGFLRYDSWLRADTAAVAFLESVLKP